MLAGRASQLMRHERQDNCQCSNFLSDMQLFSIDATSTTPLLQHLWCCLSALSVMPAKVPVLLAIPLLPKFLLPRSFITASKVASKQQCRNFGIRSIQRPNPSRFDRGPGLKGKLSSQKAALRRRIDADTLPHRTGALAIKRGMTSVFDPETGVRTPCTVLQLDGAQVVAHKTKKQHGYNAVCVGCGSKAVKNTTLPMLGHYSAQGVAPKKHLHEFRVLDHKGLLPVGEVIHADWFIPGQYVDARADCKGKGFQGVMKRWGMHGQDRSHGVSLAHRSLGSAGQGQGGGSRVYPGKKMAGNMGGQQVTQQNLRVVEVRREEGIVVVAGKIKHYYDHHYF